MTTRITPKKQEEEGNTSIATATESGINTHTHTERNATFDSEVFRKVWQAFFSKSTSSYATIFFNANITVKDCPNVALEIPKNIALQDEFERIKVKLMPYLANELANDHIVFHITYTEIQAPPTTKTLTEQEKLNLLIQKYPLLGDAVQRFGLSLE